MNRTNPIERLLLSRCLKYSNDQDGSNQIDEILEKRYSINGDQKNFMILESTDGGVSREEVNKLKNLKKKNRRRGGGISLIGAMSHGNEDEVKEDEDNGLDEDLIHLSTDQRDNKFNPAKTRNEFKSFIQSNLNLQKRLIKKLEKKLKQDNVKIDEGTDIIDQYGGEFNKLLKFEDFLDMNSLWKGYIKELIIGNNASQRNLNITNVTNKLTTSEFIGSLIEVKQSKILGNIGMKGIIIWESQYNYIVVVPRNDNWKYKLGEKSLGHITTMKKTAKDLIGGIRIISKKGTQFSIEVELDNDNNYLEFIVLGDRITFKSFDRANRKFKARNVSDIFV